MRKILALVGLVGLAALVAIEATPCSAQLLMAEQVPFRTRLSVGQERDLCRLQVGQDNWRARWCAALTPDRADQFDRCYRGCLRDEARARFCDLGAASAKAAAFSPLASREASRIEITEGVAERCATVCFDSVQ